MADLIKNTEEKSVSEFILGMGFEEKEMIGYGDFYEAFVDEWKLSKEEAKAIFTHIKSITNEQRNAILCSDLISELKKATVKLLQKFFKEHEQKVTDILNKIQSSESPSLQQTFGHAQFTTDGSLDVHHLLQILKNNYPTLPIQDLRDILKCFNNRDDGRVLVSDVQSFLIKHTKSKQVLFFFN